MTLSPKSEAKEKAEAKSRLLAKARKLARDIERYAAFGFVTSVESYEADDRKLLRGVDSLYDLARKNGLADDPDVQQYRLELRQAWSAARARAAESRRQLNEGRVNAFGARRVRDAYDEDLALARAKGKL